MNKVADKSESCFANSIARTNFRQEVENPAGMLDGKAVTRIYDYGLFNCKDIILRVVEKQVLPDLLVMRCLSRTINEIVSGFMSVRCILSERGRIIFISELSIVDNEKILSFIEENKSSKTIKIHSTERSEDIKQLINFIKGADLKVLGMVDTIELFNGGHDCGCQPEELQQLLDLLDKLPNLKLFFVKYIFKNVIFRDCMESFKCNVIVGSRFLNRSISSIDFSQCSKLKSFDCDYISTCILALPSAMESFICKEYYDMEIHYFGSAHNLEGFTIIR